MHFQSSFEYPGNPSRVIFGQDALARLRREVDRLQSEKVFVVTSPELGAQADRVSKSLHGCLAGLFDKATMHTPVHVTESAQARLNGADCLVSVGGGSAIGLAKALALRHGLPHIAVPTTFAGSEATPILGETAGKEKKTINDPALRPATILYDPAMVSSLPSALVVTSAVNAIAHAAEGLYARNRNPVSSMMAVEGMRAVADAVPKILADRADLEAWALAQYGAWLCGTVLGQVGMALHHKLCHILGGSFALPHAETHTIVLPHSVAYNEVAVPELLAPMAGVFRAPTAASGLRRFCEEIGAPIALQAFGFERSDISGAVDMALANPYWNPRPLTRDGLEALLTGATTGAAPDQTAHSHLETSE